MNSIYRRDTETLGNFREPPDVFLHTLYSLCGSASLRFILVLALIASSCSVPNLEQPECDQARDVVREFYSRHFGSVVPMAPNGLEEKREYLTPRYFGELSSRPQQAADPFTQTADPPKAFRAGECHVVEPGRRVSFELLLFWKTDTRTEQRSIAVEAENQEGKWLIDKVTN